MGTDLEHRCDLKSLTTSELKQRWVEACKSWATNPGVEPAGIAAVEAELDRRDERLTPRSASAAFAA